jgi:5-methylcytosine-specific restriction enzyme A
VSNPHWPPGWKRTRRLVLARDRYRCTLELPGCGGRATEADHIIPRRYGGGDELSNLRAACRSCNARRSDGSGMVGDPASAW